MLGGKVMPARGAREWLAAVTGGGLRGQARDLRQLLVLYDVWGRNAAPALAPAKFFDSLEKLGQGAPLKVPPPAFTSPPPSPSAVHTRVHPRARRQVPATCERCKPHRRSLEAAPVAETSGLAASACANQFKLPLANACFQL